MDQPVIGVEPWGGRTKAIPVDHYGPSSYTTGGETWPQQNSYGGPNSLGLNGVFWCIGGITEDGLYTVQPVFGGSASSKGQINLKWRYTSLNQGVTGVTSSGGSGMTAGTYALAFSGGGGSGAAGTITVTASAVTSIIITNPGGGYTSAPTVTAATGGTPPTLTATVGPASGGEVAATTNLSASYLRLLVLGG